MADSYIPHDKTLKDFLVKSKVNLNAKEWNLGFLLERTINEGKLK